MPSLLDSLISGLARVPPRAGIAAAPHDPPLSVSLVIFVVLVAVASLMLAATLAAL